MIGGAVAGAAGLGDGGEDAAVHGGYLAASVVLLPLGLLLARDRDGRLAPAPLAVALLALAIVVLLASRRRRDGGGRSAGGRRRGAGSSGSAVPDGRGALCAAYAFMALAAGARAVVQIATEFDAAPLAFTLSAASAAVYLLAAVALCARAGAGGRSARPPARPVLLGVLAIGTWSLLDPALFPTATVWSGFGSGYGCASPLALLLGLLHQWRRRPSLGEWRISPEHVARNRAQWNDWAASTSTPVDATGSRQNRPGASSRSPSPRSACCRGRSRGGMRSSLGCAPTSPPGWRAAERARSGSTTSKRS